MCIVLNAIILYFYLEMLFFCTLKMYVYKLFDGLQYKVLIKLDVFDDTFVYFAADECECKFVPPWRRFHRICSVNTL